MQERHSSDRRIRREPFLHPAEHQLDWLLDASLRGPLPDGEIRQHLAPALLEASGGPDGFNAGLASDSDMVFGIFSMRGYRFAPRFADLGYERFWRADLPDGTTPVYGPLEAIARNKINRQKITTQWSSMTRVAGSLVTNQVRAYDLLRMFARGGRPTPLGQAFAEYGRIDKTLHLLSILDPIDDTYRRRLNKQLTVRSPGIDSPARSATAQAGRSGRLIGRARRISQPRWGWSSMRSRCGIRSICRPPSTSCGRRACRSRMRMPPGSAHSATPTSTSWAAKPSPPPHRPKACASSARSPTCPTAGRRWRERACRPLAPVRDSP